MLNRDTDRVTIICFPPGSGGKFLLALLSLADECVFANSQLAQLQLDGKFTQDDKVNFLTDQLQKARNSNRWDDFDLGCIQFFGFPPWEQAFTNPTFANVTAKYCNPVVNNVLMSRYKFFVTSHDTGNLRQYMNFWPGARVIFFTNFLKFISRRHNGINNWARMNSELYELDVKEITQSMSNEKFFLWNTAWYNNTNDLISNVKNCYNWLRLTAPSDDIIVNFYNDWIETIRGLQWQ